MIPKINLDCWVAQFFLFQGYSTITIGPFVFSKEKKLPQSIINHECIHTRQWVETTILAAIIIWSIMLAKNISPLWLLLAPVAMYALYLVEWFIKLFFYGGKAYKHLSFEREACRAEDDEHYFENSWYFAWIKYIF